LPFKEEANQNSKDLPYNFWDSRLFIFGFNMLKIQVDKGEGYEH
jgi:hypothetical protein